MDPGGLLQRVGRRSAMEPAEDSCWTLPDAAPFTPPRVSESLVAGKGGLRKRLRVTNGAHPASPWGRTIIKEKQSNNNSTRDNRKRVRRMRARVKSRFSLNKL